MALPLEELVQLWRRLRAAGRVVGEVDGEDVRREVAEVEAVPLAQCMQQQRACEERRREGEGEG